MKDNAWFVGFAPCYKPEIVIAVLWENCGLHGQFAAPIARDVMVSYFNKKERIAEEARAAAECRAGAGGGRLSPGAGERTKGPKTKLDVPWRATGPWLLADVATAETSIGRCYSSS